MLKVVIAAVDQTTIDSVNVVIQEQVKEVKIVGVVNNGHDAVSQTLSLKPNILIIGIKILGLNGLEAIRQIRMYDQEVRIIIISAYDYFEFAREAMLLKVSDYLLLPINPIQLVKTLKGLGNDIRREKEENYRARQAETQLVDSHELLEDSFVFSILFSDFTEYQLKQYKKILHIKDQGYVLIIELDPLSTEDYWDIEKNYNQINYQISLTLKQRVDCLISSKILNHIIIYVNCDEDIEARDIRAESIRVSKKITSVLEEKFKIDSTVGIGSYRPLKKIYISFQEALQCLYYKKEGPIIHIKELKHRPMDYRKYLVMQEQLVESIKYGKQDGASIYTSMLELLRTLDNKHRVNKIVELLVVSNYEVQKNSVTDIQNTDFSETYHELIQIDNVDRQINVALTKFNNIVLVNKSGRVDRKLHLINNAKEYLQRHYTEEISLNEIANYVNLSPQHFCKIFKETTNSNYVEWVANLRISKAKELLNSSDKTIKEICYLVGYQDPNYFSRIFKKYVGVSPTDYVKERAD